MYVYCSKRVESQAKEHGIWDGINHLISRIEQSGPTAYTLFFEPRYPCWIRKIKDNLRLIAAAPQTFKNNIPVLYLADILKRGQREYDPKFLNNPGHWARHHTNWSGVEAWLDDQLSQPNQIFEKTDFCLPDVYHTWFKRPMLMRSSNQLQDQVIYESKIWVNTLQDPQSSLFARKEVLHKMLLYLTGLESTSQYQTLPTRINNIKKLYDSATKTCILFGKVNANSNLKQSVARRSVLFLLAGFEYNPSDADVTRIGNNLDLFGINTTHNVMGFNGYYNHFQHLDRLTIDDIARYSRRSYPDYILCDFQSWQSMQSDTDVNLAMSGEEEQLLYTMQFPAFINGRAGSGKSTMLHYAFSYYCDLYLKQQRILTKSTDSHDTFDENCNDHRISHTVDLQNLRPLFLTYSDRLTDKARKNVRQILASHAHYVGNGQPVDGQELNSLDKSFQSFQSFLLSRLPIHQVDRFKSSQHISFHQFKQRYKHSIHDCPYSPEVCWYAIRTYIKGYSFEESDERYLDFLSLDDWHELIPRRHKKIADEDFKSIYHKVWDWYKKLQEREQLWDDQDLARAVLSAIANHETSRISYSAIFCDEAQDFTRIEFQLILRLSVWSQYELPRFGLESLPFAFAGDPMQTLNPTGFRWDSFQANFYENILLPLDPNGDRNLGSDRLRLKELHQNYRSPPPIVKFTNIIHLWRRVLFETKDLCPQEPWGIEDKPRPRKSILNVDLTIEELRTMKDSGATFLLPCDEGGELDFIQSSSYLKTLFSDTPTGKVPLKVHTPSGLKGLERSHIVVYLFGDYYAQQFGKTPLHLLSNTADNLQLEYFFNKLYVAVSRATCNLTIVDTPIGEDVLWGTAISYRTMEMWLRKVQHNIQDTSFSTEIWQRNVDYLSSYGHSEITQIDFKAEAKASLMEGIDNKDQQWIDEAIADYQRAEVSAAVQYCEAWKLRLRGELQKAGRAFMSLTDLNDPDFQPMQDAWQCFWDGQCWPELVLWFQQADEQMNQNIWVKPVQFMQTTATKKIETEAIAPFAKFVCGQSEDFWTEYRLDVTWREMLEQYRMSIAHTVDRLARKTGAVKLPTSESFIQWGKGLEQIADHGIKPKVMAGLAARCFYEAKQYRKAIELWDQHGQTPPEYNVAKGEDTAVPDNIIWLSKANLWDRIVTIWLENGRSITGEWASHLPRIRKALAQQQQMPELLEVYIQNQQWGMAIALTNTHSFQANHRFKIINRIAHDPNCSYQHMELSQQQQISQFIQTEMNQWSQTSPQNTAQILSACVALEKMNYHGIVLPIFEQLVVQADLPDSLQTFIKERWLVIKGRRINALEHNSKLMNKEREDRNQRAKQWNIRWQELPAELLTLPLANQPEILASDAMMDGADVEYDQLQHNIVNGLQGLSLEELKQVNHYIYFLRYLQAQKMSGDTDVLL